MSSGDEQAELARVRQRIDAIDQEILGLISERAACAQEVARIKARHGQAAHFYRPEREAQVLARIKAENPGPLTGEEMARLFREIMSACLALEQPLRVAFLGPEGTFTQAAALKHFGHSMAAVPLPAIDEVFREVESGSADYGVVPVENSTEGVVNHTLDMFIASPLKIAGEVELRIHHHLAAHCELTAVTRVYSHQQSLAQCREWLDRNLPGAERVAVSSNAEAARRIAQEQGVAAICGEVAAELYGVPVRQRNIEDDPNNTTRFLIVGRQTVPPSGRDKTTLLISARNRAGALHHLLEPIARNRVDMTRIESRPSRRGTWQYVFFIDLDGHQDDEQVAQALTELADQATLFKVLGSFPRGVL